MDEQMMRVVINDENQYSIWPEGKVNPIGWENQGFTGTRAECLEFIGTVWTDMRPNSILKILK
ncbi:MbtH protein [Fontibacillus panacisegetis]|uniref:MbtH protein n=1 Tax=Fontibacillus panacisegetis TaxID=670482 RepID=A0A1G7HI76_9BACL|nr:MbtH family NRPS accessory protein [Fontibacillus panacisegetis]SDE99719.1 MbtH protein [Fontibacillus panacisegetis]